MTNGFRRELWEWVSFSRRWLGSKKKSIRNLYLTLWPVAGAVAFLYGSIFLLNALGIEFLFLVRGRGMVSFPLDIVLFGRLPDMIIFGTSSLFVFSALYPLFRRDAVTPRLPQLFYAGVLSLFLFAVIEISSLARWIVSGFIPGVPFVDASWTIPLIEMQLANALAPWAPRIMLIFLFSWLFTSLFRYHRVPGSRLVSRMLQNIKRPAIEAHENATNFRLSKILLIFGLMIAIFVASYPYLEAVNEGGRLIGVDTPFYLDKLDTAQSSSLSGALSVAMGDDRTILHLFNYFLLSIIGNTTMVMKVLPVVLSILLVLSTFVLVKTATGDSYLAGISALFTPLAFQQIVGMNAGFYANWLALIEANIFFAVLLRALKVRRFSILLSSGFIGILILFTHPWTWFVIMFSVSILMVIGFLSKSSRGTGSFMLLTVLSVNALADAVRSVALPGLQSGAIVAPVSLLSGLRIADMPIILGVLGVTFTTFLGGALYNLPLLLLATVGFLAIGTYRNHFNVILLALAITGLIGVFLFSSNFESYLQARAIYVIPFAIFGAIGFTTLTKFFRVVGVSGSSLRLLNVGIGLSITAAMLNHTLRVVSSLFPLG